MVAFRITTLVMAAACTMALASAPMPAADARGTYDGAWNVAISGNSGNCDGMSYQYGVQIVNNSVRYGGGDAKISGTVGSNGDVSVNVANANGSAAGTGHLSNGSGRGKFHGRSKTGACTGTWTATRTGG